MLVCSSAAFPRARARPGRCCTLRRERPGRSSGDISSACSSSSSIWRHRSGSIVGLRVEFLVKPRLGLVPFADDGDWREAHDFCSLVDTQSAEEAQLDDLTFARGRISPAPAAHRRARPGHHCDRRKQLRLRPATRAELAPPRFCCLRGAREANQDVPHQPGGYAEEVRPVLPAHLLPVDQPHPGFIDERRRLQRMVGAFPGEVMVGQPTQLGFNERRQLLEGRRDRLLATPAA